MKLLIVLATLNILLAVVPVSAQKTVPSPSPSPAATNEEAEPKTSVYGEVAMSSMYHGFDLGGDFCRCKSTRGWFTLERKLNKRFTAYFGSWGQVAFSGAPGSDEADVSGGLLIKVPRSTTLRIEVANYKVHDLSVRKLGLQIAKKFVVGKQPFSFSSELIRFSTSQKQRLKGGVVNRMSLSTSVALPGKLKLSGGPGLGIDNGPFGLGGPAALLFLSARLERPITKHWSIFGTGKHSRSIAGTTVRRPIYSGEFGLAFRY